MKFILNQILLYECLNIYVRNHEMENLILQVLPIKSCLIYSVILMTLPVINLVYETEKSKYVFTFSKLRGDVICDKIAQILFLQINAISKN